MKWIVFLFLILNLSMQAQHPWKYHVIDNVGSGADGVKLADINGDERLDITTGWEESGVTKLYIHPEKNRIKESWLSVVIAKTPNVEDAVFADMNCDGSPDIVSCTENNSQKIFVSWNPGKDILNSENWKQEVLPASDTLMSWMYAEPMQVDGKNATDLVAAGKGENAAIGWFEAPKEGTRLVDWKWHEISNAGWIMSIIKNDMDADDDIDLLITDRRGSLCGCRWLENPGNYEKQKKNWQNHFIGAQGLEVMFMCIQDINGDEIPEVFVPERTENKIRIFSKNQRNDTAWNMKIISLPKMTGKAKSVELGDINNDGIDDLVVSTNTLKDKKDGLIWLSGKSLKHTKEEDWRSISGRHKAKYGKVELLDMDNDGDLDILVCEENFGDQSKGLGVVWYENPIIK